MRKQVYLFELDSVKNTDEEIIRAFNALYDEIVINGNIVVMTFNQLVDSRGFFSLFADERFHESLLSLFENGALRISRFGDIRTVTQYLLNSTEDEKQFIYSALPIKNSQRRLVALIRRSLMYCDLSEINAYIEGKEKSEEELKDLFAEVNANEGPGKISVSESGLSTEQMKEILKNLYWLLTAVLKISMMHTAFIRPRERSEYEGLHLKDFLKAALTAGFEADELFNGAAEVLKSLGCLSSDDRSVYFREIERAAAKDNSPDKTKYMYAQAIVSLCYNYACEASIADVSRHYDAQEFKKGGKCPSFEAEFKSRLAYEWDGGRAKEERYLKKETNKFTAFSRVKEIPPFKAAVRFTRYADYAQEGEKRQQVYGYESGLKEQKRSHRRKIRKRAAKGFGISFLYVLIGGLVNYMFELGQNAADSRAGSFAVSLAVFIAFMFAAEAITDVLSKYFNIPDLSDALENAFKYIADFFRFKKKRSFAYSNGYTDKNLTEPKSALQRDDYMIPARLKAYIKLKEDKNRSYLFEEPKESPVPIADVTDKDMVAQIIKTEEMSGRRFGVVYKSPYNTMIADPVLDEEGKIYSYERLFQTPEGGGMAVLIKRGDNFLLLKQFRHALRRYQYAFPRGFTEPGETPKEGALRELKEELGEVEIKDIQLLGRIATDSGLTAACPYIFAAEIGDYSGNKGHEGIADYIEVSEGTLEEMIRKGETDDAFTICAAEMYKVRRGKDAAGTYC